MGEEISASVAALVMPAWLHEVVSFARNVSLIAIPFVLWFASRAVERRRAALEVVRSLDSEIKVNLERLFTYRKYQEQSPLNLPQCPKNPYKDAEHLFLFDSVMVLNYYEAICSEILSDNVDEAILYSSIKNSVIGAAEVVLKRYNDSLKKDQSRNYKHLVEIADRWTKRASPFGEIGATQIPNR